MIRTSWKLTTPERKAIEHAWHVIEARMQSWSNQDSLKRALKYETTGSDACERIQAKALLVNWFSDGALSPDMPARYLHSCRPAAVLMTMAGAALAHKSPMTESELDAFDASRLAYNDCKNRALAQ